jgi:hypothetical protein
VGIRSLCSVVGRRWSGDLSWRSRCGRRRRGKAIGPQRLPIGGLHGGDSTSRSSCNRRCRKGWVWVTEPRCAVAVAIALRESLIELSAARLAGEGPQIKMEPVYQDLTGPRFRHHVSPFPFRG